MDHLSIADTGMREQYQFEKKGGQQAYFLIEYLIFIYPHILLILMAFSN